MQLSVPLGHGEPVPLMVVTSTLRAYPAAMGGNCPAGESVVELHRLALMLVLVAQPNVEARLVASTRSAHSWAYWAACCARSLVLSDVAATSNSGVRPTRPTPTTTITITSSIRVKPWS